jgi:indolepyruvate ferredoxin oxidoreductase beta subunit
MSALKELNVIICGVGGQGVVLMSELLGNAAIQDGIGVKGSEVLGMAQRGGSVQSNIRFGSDVYSPLTSEGKCDLLIALEPTEALRNINYLSESSIVILNTKKVVPYTVFLGMSSYPGLEEILHKLYQATKRVIALNAAPIAEEAGNLLAVNSVMVGALFATGRLPLNVATIKTVIHARFPSKLASDNIRAFELGYQSCVQARKKLSL